MGDHLHQRGVVEPGGAGRRDVGGRDAAAFRDEPAGEGERRAKTRIGGLAAAGGGDVGGRQSRGLAEIGVGGEAIVAGVGLADGERQRLADARRQHAVAERIGEAEQPLEGGRRLGGDAVEVRHGADPGLHGLEEFAGLAGGGGGIESGNAGHDG